MTEHSDESLPATVTYQMTYRLVGPAYPEGRYPDRQRVLTVFRDGHVWEARTDEEAAASIREFVSRPLIDAAIEVVRVTKVTTIRRYEDVSHLSR